MARFETETLSTKDNLKHLMNLPGQWIDKAHQHRQLKKLILDMDSSVSETYGHQEGSAYNGHFGCSCYYPLFLFNQFGDLERVLLRRGNRGSANYWRRVLLPVIERYRGRDTPSSSGAMQRLPARSYCACWSGKPFGTPSASSPTPCWNGRSPRS